MVIAGCLGYHCQIKNDACPPKQCQKSLRWKLVPILPAAYGVATKQERFENFTVKFTVNKEIN